VDKAELDSKMLCAIYMLFSGQYLKSGHYYSQLLRWYPIIVSDPATVNKFCDAKTEPNFRFQIW